MNLQRARATAYKDFYHLRDQKQRFRSRLDSRTLMPHTSALSNSGANFVILQVKIYRHAEIMDPERKEGDVALEMSEYC